MSEWSEPPAGARVAETVLTVRSYELDSFGHVNHAVFLNYLEHGRFDALAQAGFPYASIVARGWGIYVVRIEVDYVAEALLGDRLLVRTWAVAFRRSSMVLGQRIVRTDGGDAQVARARITAVWVGTDRRPMRVPSEVSVALGAPESEAPLDS
jgi:acyl-CoA thioester hydrolase